MNRTTRWSRVAALILAAAVGGLVIGGWNARSAAPPAPTAVAVVDFAKVLDGLAEREAIEKQREPINKERDRIEKELADTYNRLKTELDALPPADAIRKRAEVEQAKSAYAIRRQAHARESQLERARYMLGFYKSMVKACAALASSEGWELVLIDDRGATMPEEKDFEDMLNKGENPVIAVLQTVSSRQVIYANGRIDITDRLITYMNNAFKTAPKP